MNQTEKRVGWRQRVLCGLVLGMMVAIGGCAPTQDSSAADAVVSLDEIPAYSGEAYVEVNENEPAFSEDDYTEEAFESYSELDELGRCGTAFANVCTDIMPTQERGSIGSVKPSGWHTVKYDVVDGKYLYNRCHLIGYQLSGENANEENLITGTRYMNVEGMLPFENQVAEYVEETDNHVLYRVTPVFEGDNLVASGVEMEAASVENRGEDLSFHVFVYNVQPDIAIDYATGESRENLTVADGSAGETTQTYIVNANTRKFHLPSCGSVNSMAKKNKKTYHGSREDLIENGFTPCETCQP